MEVREAMARTYSTVGRNESIERVAELMRTEDCGFVPVTEDDQVIGVITDRDIVVSCLGPGHRDPMTETVEHIMTTEVRTIGPLDSIEEAAHRMAEHHVRRLPVVENGRLTGVLSHGNLVQALHGQGAAIDATLGVTTGA
jgi:CBS domain-containing protein